MEDQKLQKELQQRDDLVFVFAFGTVLLLCLAYRAAISGFDGFAIILFFIACGMGAWSINRLTYIFRLRDDIIAFKQNVDPLFAHSDCPFDNSVIYARNRALDGLRLAGVERLKVYTIIYRDVVVFSHWWEVDKKGKWTLHSERKERHGITVNEGWDAYAEYVQKFKAEKINKYRLDMWKRNEPEHVERHVLGQEF